MLYCIFNSLNTPIVTNFHLSTESTLEAAGAKDKYEIQQVLSLRKFHCGARRKSYMKCHNHSETLSRNTDKISNSYLHL